MYAKHRIKSCGSKDTEPFYDSKYAFGTMFIPNAPTNIIPNAIPAQIP